MILRGRYWELTAGFLRIRWDDPIRQNTTNRPLTIQFDITKSLDREPNKALIQIYNLTPTNRRALSEAEGLQIALIAGYQEADTHDTIFVGDAEDIYTERTDSGTDWITTIESRDGGSAYRRSRIAQTFEPNVALSTVIRGCADALGIGRGNSDSIASSAELDSGGSIFPDGITLEGPAWRALDMVCRSASLRWSIQNGVLQLRPLTAAAESRAVLLSPETGLIGSPTRGNQDTARGGRSSEQIRLQSELNEIRSRLESGEISEEEADRLNREAQMRYQNAVRNTSGRPDLRYNVEVKSLLIPGIFPGRSVVLRSSTISGSYMAKTVRYTGDSTGNDWYATTVLTDLAA